MADRRNSTSVRHTCQCGKRFRRKEHLIRHKATHEQPAYSCNLCERRFSRREVLRRHLILHDPNQTRTLISCETCRANKTKCSGSTPCLLCLRRGVNCTFRSHFRQSQTTSADVRAANASISGYGGNHNNDDGATVLANSKSEERLAEILTRAGGKPSRHEWLQDLIIVPSRPAPESQLKPFRLGMEAIYDLLIADEPTLEGATRRSDKFQHWLSERVETYVQSFHLRWPIFNGPSLDVVTESLLVAASVCVIGTWLRSDTNKEERLCALRVHEILLQRLLEKIIEPGLIPEGKAWPIGLFEAVLLTLIFSILHTDQGVSSRAMLLRGIFISLLRDIGMLNAGMLADHLRLHFNGTYVPYKISMRQKFIRLVASTFQFDVYFALIYQKPPLLHRQEVGAGLMNTFALWNTYDLDVFAERLLEEPTERQRFEVFTVTDCPGSLEPSKLLVEDIVLGLCGLLQEIWFLTASQSEAKEPSRDNFRREVITEKLDAWKDRLDEINKWAYAGDTTSEGARYLLLAYRREDDSTAAALERIVTLVQDGMVLFYCLKMYLLACLILPESVTPVKHPEGPCTETLGTAEDGREALACALQVLQIASLSKCPKASSNPLVRHALVMGARITRRMISSCEKCENCESLAGGNPRSLQKGFRAEAEGHFDTTEVVLCACKLKFWIEIFENAIRDRTV